LLPFLAFKPLIGYIDFELGGIMRLFLVFMTALSFLYSAQSLAADRVLKFKIRKLSANLYDTSYVWNPHTQEATIRMGLVQSEDAVILDRPLAMSSAKSVKLVVLDALEYTEGCSTVKRWQLEYQPDLPDYLMYVTLKGPTCERLAKYIDIFHTRWRFLGLSDAVFMEQDVSVEISR